MQKVLEENPGARLRVIVVWEPVLLTDIAPPTTHALSRLSDARAAQLWDRGRALSRAMGGTDDDVLWDYVAIYPAGAKWDDAPPVSVFDGGPVVDVIDDVRRWLAPAR